MIKPNYLINKCFSYMWGFYDCHGNPCTVVKERDRIFVVEQSPLDILDKTIRDVGFTLSGAMEVARDEHPNNDLCPIMVNPILKIVVFPTESPNRVETMWINPDNVKKADHSKCMTRKTTILFASEHRIILNSKLSSFNSKLETAKKYRRNKTKTGKRVISFMVDPKNKDLFGLLLAVKPFMDLMDVIATIC